jgi:hypothetical protein
MRKQWVPPPLYTVWKSMKSRCYRKTTKQYEDCGGRGITVCQEWRNSFDRFVKDMGPRPNGHTLERKNNDLNYNKDNCKWATRKEQQRNRRCTVFVTVGGKQFKAIELAEINGIKFDTVVDRARRGLPYQQVVQKEKLPDMSDPSIRKLAGIKSSITRRAKPACKRGHLLEEPNMYIANNGQRVCRACRHLKYLAFKARN